MGDRLSHCCCVSCDIFRCDFDLRYVVPAIPADTSDWRQVWDVIGTGLDNTARLFEIAPGQVGEGLIFRQSLSAFNPTADAVFPKGRQRFIPVYQTHPIVSDFAAFPNWNMLGISFHYEIRNPLGAITPGFYRLNASGITGPVAPPNLNSVLEPAWPTYWRRHFTLHDADGEIDLEFDRVPFVLNPGEYLLSKQRMPAAWFGINAIRAFHQSWAAGASDAETILRFVADGQTIVGMRQTIVEISGLRRQKPIIELADGDSVISPRQLDTGVAPNSPHPGRRGRWWLFRDRSIDLSETFSGVEPVEDFLESLSNNQVLTFGPSRATDSERSRFVTNIQLPSDPFPRTRLLLTVANQPQRLGTVMAARLRAESTEADLHSACGPVHTCPIIFPHTHVKWELKEFSIPGVVTTDAASYVSVHCNRQCDFKALHLTTPIGTIELPTKGIGDFVQPDNTRSPRNLSLAFGPVQPALGYSFDAITENQLASASGGKVRVIIDQPSEIAPQVRVRVWLDTRYLSSPILDADLFGSPIPWSPPWFGWSGPSGIHYQTSLVQNFYVDDELFQPNPEEIGVGWSLMSGPAFHFYTQKRLMMYWERILNRWDGPLPEIELTGQEFDFNSPFLMAANQTLVSSQTFTQSRFINILTSAQASITGYTPANQMNQPDVPLVTTTGTFQTIDLRDLVLRLGPPA